MSQTIANEKNSIAIAIATPMPMPIPMPIPTRGFARFVAIVLALAAFFGFVSVAGFDVFPTAGAQPSNKKPGPKAGKSAGQPRGKPSTPPEDATWWNQGWRYRVPVTVTQVRLGPAAAVTLATASLGRKDGADVRVVDPDGQPVPHRLLDVGRDHGVTLAFPVPWRKAAREARLRYHVYFGNPHARPLPDPYDGAHGPLLEVRRPGKTGGIRNWEDMQSLIQASPEVIGRRPLDRIYIGLNPFGSDRACVTLIRGWLNCRRPGRHDFAVNAWDAAFFLVSDHLVVQWPGEHPPYFGSSRRHAGQVKLDRGWHSCLYAHASARRGACCSLGVKAPGGKRLTLAPASSFLRWVPVTIDRLEVRNRKSTAFFTWQPHHDLGLTPRDVTAVKFRELASFPRDHVRRWQWDFGDGTAADQPDPDHVFLTRGRFPVRLTVLLKSGTTIVQTEEVAVHPAGTSGHAIYNLLKEDAKLLATYDPEKLSPEANLNAVFVFRALKHYEKAAPFLSAAFRTQPPLTTQAMVEEALFLADYLRVDRDKPEEALALYRYLAKKAKRKSDRRWATAWVGLLELDALHDVTRARATLEGLLHENARARDDATRLALLKLADVHLEQGERDRAVTRLLRAQDLQPQKTFGGDLEVAHGQHLVAYEEFMAHQDWTGALRTLEAWEWAAPRDKLAGTLQFLRADLHVARGRPDLALVEIRRLERASPKSADLPSALILAAACHEKRGETEPALACYQRLIREFPTTAAAQEARKRLAGKPGTKTGEAGKNGARTGRARDMD